MNNITVGQVLERKDGSGKQKVLGVCDGVVFMSMVNTFNSCVMPKTFVEVEDMYILPKTKWRPEDRFFYFVHSSGKVMRKEMTDSPKDKFRQQAGNCFSTVLEAEAYKQKLLKLGEE